MGSSGLSGARDDDDTPSHAPSLDEREAQEVDRSRGIGAPVIHEAIRLQGEAELGRPAAALAWSGLAAGLSMGFSLVAEGVLRAHLPDAPWTPLVSKLGYSVGFLVVILGQQQLFTENTLTVVLPVLARRDRATLLGMLRLWGIVLATNVAGAALVGTALARSGVFEPEVRAAFAAIAGRAMEPPAGTILMRGIFAGWLIALMVWMLPAARHGRATIVVIITWLVGAADLSHIVAGSVEVLHLVAAGAVAPMSAVGHYMVPALVGNVIGGVSLVAALNHAQVVAGERRS